jgi:ATPase subunit of ABC transporter with duplicated ATPase domains
VLVISHDLPCWTVPSTACWRCATDSCVSIAATTRSSWQLEEERRLSEEKIAAHQDAKIEQFSTLADSMRGQTAKRARLAKVLDRRVEKLKDTRIEVTKKEKKVVFRLPVPPRSGDVPMTVEHVAVRYGQLEVLRDVNFITRRGDRIVIVGKNGAGKSSLLRCLAGTQDAQEGIVKFGANVTVGYFAQENEQLDFDENRPRQPRQLDGRVRRAASLDARRVRSERLGRAPDAGHALGWGTSEVRAGHPGVLKRESCCCWTNRPTTSTRRAWRPWAR